MVSMDFINCSKYRSIKSCCSEKSSMDDENKNNEFRNKDCIFLERKNKIEDGYSTVNVEPLRFVKNVHMKDQINGDIQKESFSSFNTQEEKDFRCPRCGQSMQEPRLLPCLHPICSTCISELMSKPFDNFTKSIKTQNNQSESSQNNYYEICPLCDVQLPNANSTVPPPHYPLQYRLVMSAIRSKFTNKILCDICPDEVVAVVQCSTCLRNFCLDCGMKHQQQITMELKPLKHSIRPLMEATKVTCKECMWSSQHRGHASENAVGVAKRVILYLTKMLQRAKMVLNMLLTQYDRDAFLNSSFEEIKDTCISVDYRYVKLTIF
ncbi:tripartite motif-containing protein 42-like isoform X2 [Bombus affinis]|uniref:tripartite motif-containing protein 42-like isoform X2 n=1 Tax=Bombus affinis TaxID=309941 RepID=UPI0021B74380|nr:tripartite motif-containing protein 42-like isoform X2 [Bombus affinis]